MSRNERLDPRRECDRCGKILPIATQVCTRCGEDLDYPTELAHWRPVSSRKPQGKGVPGELFANWQLGEPRHRSGEPAYRLRRQRASAASFDGFEPPQATADAFLASIPADPLLVAAAAQHEGVSASEAERRLRFQTLDAFIYPKVVRHVAGGFAGLDYNRATSRFTVQVVDNHYAQIARTLISTTVAEQYVGVRVVKHSLNDLLAKQRAFVTKFEAAQLAGDQTIAIDVANNGLRVDIAQDASSAHVGAVKQEVARFDAPVTYRTVDRNRLKGQLTCSWPHCDRPLRGGVAITPKGFSMTNWCTAGFLAVWPSDYSKKYVVTAAHCLSSNVLYPKDDWKARAPASGDQWIGPNVGRVFDVNGDMMRLRVNNPGFWYTSALVGRTAAWGNNTNLKVTGWSGFPPNGALYCRYGATTPSAYGYVNSPGPTCFLGTCNQWSGTACADHGDSGGPATGYGNIAYGILTGKSEWAPCNPTPFSNGSITYFTSIDAIQNILGVWIIWEP